MGVVELLALVREPGDSMAACELSHVERTPIDAERLREQHAAYVDALRALGARVECLPALPGHPDAVFVEDTAVVLDEVAIISRPGAASRRGETDSVAARLALHRPLVQMTAPATLDGGDVLVIGKRIFVGVSARTNAEGRAQLAAAAAPFGYDVIAVETRDCLHLKSAVTALDDATVLIQRDWLKDAAPFDGYAHVEIDPEEPHAANVVRVGGRLLMPAGFPRTRERIEQAGFEVVEVDVSELQKAEGAVTCCSILVPQVAAR